MKNKTLEEKDKLTRNCNHCNHINVCDFYKKIESVILKMPSRNYPKDDYIFERFGRLYEGLAKICAYYSHSEHFK